MVEVTLTTWYPCIVTNIIDQKPEPVGNSNLYTVISKLCCWMKLDACFALVYFCIFWLFFAYLLFPLVTLHFSRQYPGCETWAGPNIAPHSEQFECGTDGTAGHCRGSMQLDPEPARSCWRSDQLGCSSRKEKHCLGA